MSTTSYEQFLATLSEAAPPPDLEPALRALWYDANGRADSALRAAMNDPGHLGLRVCAYLHRKAGRAEEARLWYFRSGAAPWQGSPGSEWQDIVHTVLTERVVRDAYI
jgi:hypothetical protein